MLIHSLPPPFFITLINYIRTYDSFRCHLKHIAIKIFRHIARCFPETRKNIFWFLSLKQRANCPRLTLKKKVSERSKIDNITCCLNVRELMFREEKKFMEKSQRSRQKEWRIHIDNQVSTTLNRKKALFFFFFLHPMLFRSHETDWPLYWQTGQITNRERERETVSQSDTPRGRATQKQAKMKNNFTNSYLPWNESYHFFSVSASTTRRCFSKWVCSQHLEIKVYLEWVSQWGDGFYG